MSLIRPSPQGFATGSHALLLSQTRLSPSAKSSQIARVADQRLPDADRSSPQPGNGSRDPPFSKEFPMIQDSQRTKFSQIIAKSWADDGFK